MSSDAMRPSEKAAQVSPKLSCYSKV